MADIGGKARVAGLWREVGGIAVPEVHHRLISGLQCPGLPVGLQQAVQRRIKGLRHIAFRLHHAHKRIDFRYSARGCAERFFHCKKRRHFPLISAGQMGHQFRLLQGAAANKLRQAGAEAVHRLPIAQQCSEPLFALLLFGFVVEGQSRRARTVVKDLTLHHHIGIDHIVRHGGGTRDAEHTGHHDLELPGLIRQVFDFYALGLHGVGHTRSLRQDEDRTANLQAAGCPIGDDAAALGVQTMGIDYIVPDIGGIENLATILDKIELSVGRLSVFLQLQHTAGSQHLLAARGPERAAAQRIQRTLGRRDQGIRISGPVAQQQVHRIVRTYRISLQVQHQLAAVVELARACHHTVIDSENLLRRSLRHGDFALVCHAVNRTAFEPEQLAARGLRQPGGSLPLIHQMGTDGRRKGQFSKA